VYKATCHWKVHTKDVFASVYEEGWEGQENNCLGISKQMVCSEDSVSGPQQAHPALKMIGGTK
jgi:hypothetical protein